MSYKVYVKITPENFITEVNSDLFLADTTGYQLIDEGDGDRFAHAQGNYFNTPLVDDNGMYNYKLVDGKPQSCNDIEKKSNPVLLEDTKQNKILEIKFLCGKNIIGGTNADVLGRGSLHYSLTQTEQDDIKSLYLAIENGATKVLWHDTSRVMHEVYTAEQFVALYKICFNYIIACKIRSDGLEQYVVSIYSDTTLSNADKIDKINEINWDTKLPTEIQSVVDAQIESMKLT